MDSFELFRVLGFEDIHALDVSDYEGADVILDLAMDHLTDQYRNAYDFIFDGGASAHIQPSAGTG